MCMKSGLARALAVFVVIYIAKGSVTRFSWVSVQHSRGGQPTAPRPPSFIYNSKPLLAIWKNQIGSQTKANGTNHNHTVHTGPTAHTQHREGALAALTDPLPHVQSTEWRFGSGPSWNTWSWSQTQPRIPQKHNFKTYTIEFHYLNKRGIVRYYRVNVNTAWNACGYKTSDEPSFCRTEEFLSACSFEGGVYCYLVILLFSS